MKYLNKYIPQIVPVIPEATYMMWLDCRKLGMTEKQLEEFLVHDAKVALNMGSTFGEGGEGFVRINFASPKAVIKEALDRICHALEAKKI